MSEEGVVVSKRGGRVTVEAEPSEGCCDCAARGSCMMSAHGKKRLIEMDNTADASVGDGVLFSIEERDVVAASLLLYCLPVAGLLGGAFLGGGLSGRLGIEGDAGAALGGTVFFIAALAAAGLAGRKFRKRGMFSPVLLGKLPGTGGAAGEGTERGHDA